MTQETVEGRREVSIARCSCWVGQWLYPWLDPYDSLPGRKLSDTQDELTALALGLKPGSKQWKLATRQGDLREITEGEKRWWIRTYGGNSTDAEAWFQG